ncbi:MAG: response regulator [Myxococcota bacterium]
MKRIALVEDNDDNRALIAALLEDRYRLLEYADGPSALAGLVDEPPDLILLDISLPGMDGTEVLAKLRRHDALRQVPAVALTAHAMRGDRERFLEQGFNEYVSKPIVDEEILLSAIHRLLGAEGNADDGGTDGGTEG